jgi:hypothetical protein
LTAEQRGADYDPKNLANCAFRVVDREKARLKVIGTKAYATSPEFDDSYNPLAATSPKDSQGVRTIINRLYYGCEDPPWG